MTETSLVYIRDVTFNNLVAAELLSPITERQILDWQTLWKPECEKRVGYLKSHGFISAELPQSWHWKWDEKLTQIQDLLSHMSVAVTCNNQTQSLMRVDLVSQRSRMEDTKNKDIVYIDYLEVAPWNWSDTRFPPPKYRGSGSLLLGSAIQISQQNEFKGRVGLHSLPQSVSWYLNHGFKNFGADSSYTGNLPYMELSTENAEKFLRLGVSK